MKKKPWSFRLNREFHLPEEECDQTVSPSVCPEQVQNAQPRAAEPDPCQKLELKAGLAVQRALYVVLQHYFCQLVEALGGQALGPQGQLLLGRPRGHVSEHHHEAHGQTRSVGAVGPKVVGHFMDGHGSKVFRKLVLPFQLKLNRQVVVGW